MRRRDFLIQLGLGAMGVTLYKNQPLFANASTTKPNFILMLSDDQNWSGLSVQMDPDVPYSRSSNVETPNLEAFAKQGIRFTQGYSPAPVCSPTRIAIQTGKSPAQLHWTKAGPNVDASKGYKLIAPQSPRNISPSQQTIAELLKTAGYTSAHYGKWHLGGRGPEAHGYDESDGNTSNEDAAGFKSPNPDDVFGMGKRAAAFMKKAKEAGKPFFIQMSYYPLHYPENALAETIAKYREKMPRARDRQISSAAIAENLDTGIGQLLKAVEQLGISDNTYIIYMSDNGGGGGNGRRNSALSGGKSTLLEGGIRVPFIVRGPGIAANSICRVPVTGCDLLPTFCKLGQVSQLLPDSIEGGDISHLFTGSSQPVQRRFPWLAFHFPHYQNEPPQSALRQGDYKIIRYYEDNSVKLFNLADDLGESNDLADKMPQKAAELNKLLDQYLTAVNAELPKPNPNYDPSVKFTPERPGKEGPEQKRRDRGPRRPRF